MFIDIDIQQTFVLNNASVTCICSTTLKYKKNICLTIKYVISVGRKYFVIQRN
jgi:hypothetical protein